MQQLTREQIAELSVTLAPYGLVVKAAPKVKHQDWIAERESVIRGLKLKAQSASFKTTQLKLLALRRTLSPTYEAFIGSELVCKLRRVFQNDDPIRWHVVYFGHYNPDRPLLEYRPCQ